ncbi:MAG: ATP-binding protein [Clostridia bacterium]|nr:ATP-binding protein [Clostridia bacterium]
MKELTLDAKLENIPSLTALIDEWLEGLECSVKAQMQIDVAVDEIFSNIAQYAYGPKGGSAAIRLEFDEADRTVRITFIDSGTAYNPLTKADPDVTLSAEERDIGGLGIFLVKKTMDAMKYRRENNRNMLTIHKRI